uniref:POU domain protein n=1 Tax=Anas zonorhyncha TaxID=75864 RepID=A0A8B9U3B8_9AVES
LAPCSPPPGAGAQRPGAAPAPLFLHQPRISPGRRLLAAFHGRTGPPRVAPFFFWEASPRGSRVQGRARGCGGCAVPLLGHLTPGLALGAMAGPDGAVVSTPGHAPHMAGMNPMHPAALGMAHGHGLPAHMGCVSDVDADPRDLEAFAERFKQRRIKLGVTQADVGSALANLKIPGVGSLSQSTICRFESLTLSHNNMIALKPILQAWLEEAEKSHREKLAKPELFSGAEKKRKRTSIAAPEKRSLEAYFALQPRPSSEKIAAIAEKLDLKKNVVRVWFCNQRQKQKRMKYSAGI